MSSEKKAQELLEKAGIDEIPIPVEKLARLAGAKLVFEPYDGDISGMLFRDETRTVIGVNSSHAKTRQRFTIAHEIGHLLLHQDQSIFVDKRFQVNFRDELSSMGSESQEIQANQFAAELLMPRKRVFQEVAKRVKKQTDDVEIVRELAKAFKVSPQAMEFRLTNLGLYIPP